MEPEHSLLLYVYLPSNMIACAEHEPDGGLEYIKLNIVLDDGYPIKLAVSPVHAVFV
jgi:hypothetical protein